MASTVHSKNSNKLTLVVDLVHPLNPKVWLHYIFSSCTPRNSPFSTIRFAPLFPSLNKIVTVFLRTNYFLSCIFRIWVMGMWLQAPPLPSVVRSATQTPHLQLSRDSVSSPLPLRQLQTSSPFTSVLPSDPLCPPTWTWTPAATVSQLWMRWLPKVTAVVMPCFARHLV